MTTASCGCREQDRAPADRSPNAVIALVASSRRYGCCCAHSPSFTEFKGLNDEHDREVEALPRLSILMVSSCAVMITAVPNPEAAELGLWQCAYWLFSACNRGKVSLHLE